MRVLITGIDGFVGSHAAELLVADSGVSVDAVRPEVHGSVLKLGSLNHISHLLDATTLHEADIAHPDRVSDLFREINPDRVMHIAGQAFVPSSIRDPMGTFQVNLVGGLAILEAARKQVVSTGKSPAVLIVSSGEVYGRVAQENLPITEALPLFPQNPYAASKASLDMIGQQYAKYFGVDVIIVRPFNHAGPRQNPAFVVSDFAKQYAEIALGKRDPVLHAGNVAVRRDFTDVRDVVKAYWRLFEKDSTECIFNVCSGRAVEIKELLDTLQEISGLDITISQDEDRVRSYDTPVVVASYERLRKATGWSPAIPLRQTLADTYRYWLEILGPTLSTASSTR